MQRPAGGSQDHKCLCGLPMCCVTGVWSAHATLGRSMAVTWSCGLPARLPSVVPSRMQIGCQLLGAASFLQAIPAIRIVEKILYAADSGQAFLHVPKSASFSSRTHVGGLRVTRWHNCSQQGMPARADVSPPYLLRACLTHSLSRLSHWHCSGGQGCHGGSSAGVWGHL